MVNVRHALAARSQVARSVALAPLRTGQRTVHMTPGTGVGFGNYLYLLFDAHRRQAAGSDHRVLLHAHMAKWLPALHGADELYVSPGEVRFSDRRQKWRFELADGFGTDFTRPQLQEFVKRYLLPVDRDPFDGDLVLNVRRGDYYSNPYVRGTHGMDVPAYVDTALGVAADHSPFTSVVVVSDDIAWCRTRLHHVISRFAREVTYAPGDESPQENFRRVATARRLVGTNSTFSYWGGYVSSVLHGPTSQIVMPWFHARLDEDHGARQVDPTWTIVREIPGGWDS